MRTPSDVTFSFEKDRECIKNIAAAPEQLILRVAFGHHKTA